MRRVESLLTFYIICDKLKLRNNLNERENMSSMGTNNLTTGSFKHTMRIFIILLVQVLGFIVGGLEGWCIVWLLAGILAFGISILGAGGNLRSLTRWSCWSLGRTPLLFLCLLGGTVMLLIMITPEQ